LFQWVDYGYLGAIQTLYRDWRDLIQDSHYRPLMFTPEFKWHFQRPELYKHFFTVFSEQVATLQEQRETRIEHVQERLEGARRRFDEIEQSGVVLDSNSDGSHLPFWLTAINLYRQYLSDLGL